MKKIHKYYAEKRDDAWGAHGLEKYSKAEEHAAEEDGHAGGCAGHKGRGSSASGTTSSRGGSGATEAGDWRRRRCGRSRSSSRGCGRRGAQRGIALEGRLSTARVVGTAGGAAGAVAVAVADALCAPLSADEIGECLRIFGNVGG